LKQKLATANQILQQKPIRVLTPDGRVEYYKGASFSYGTGPDLESADQAAKLDKAARRQRGEIGLKGTLVGFERVAGPGGNPAGGEGGDIRGAAGEVAAVPEGNSPGVSRGTGEGAPVGQEVKEEKKSTTAGGDESSLFSLRSGIPLNKAWKAIS